MTWASVFKSLFLVEANHCAASPPDSVTGTKLETRLSGPGSKLSRWETGPLTLDTTRTNLKTRPPPESTSCTKGLQWYSRLWIDRNTDFVLFETPEVLTSTDLSYKRSYNTCWYPRKVSWIILVTRERRALLTQSCPTWWGPRQAQCLLHSLQHMVPRLKYAIGDHPLQGNEHTAWPQGVYNAITNGPLYGN
jgi:hypothetical protein